MYCNSVYGGVLSFLCSAETQDEIKEKAAFEDLEQSFKTLTSRKIKDKLSAFLPDIPGMYHHSIATVCCHGNLYTGDLDAASMGHNTYVLEVFLLSWMYRFLLFFIASRQLLIDRQLKIENLHHSLNYKALNFNLVQ